MQSIEAFLQVSLVAMSLAQQMSEMTLGPQAGGFCNAGYDLMGDDSSPSAPESYLMVCTRAWFVELLSKMGLMVLFPVTGSHGDQ